ncbi:hypothetical protein [Hahella ganghwensis]|uniref:hypothetical protein n=1 Tax=Hahella ganghwensis TaxID=286420 RepID=UPI000372A383|nr:hypothetical protein [Hahella ganghwensis]
MSKANKEIGISQEELNVLAAELAADGQKAEEVLMEATALGMSVIADHSYDSVACFSLRH